MDPLCIVSQSYDGASVMSGKCTGVQTRVREFAPHAMYMHCHAHILNLVLVDSVKSINRAAEFFALLQTLHVFMSSSKIHEIFKAKQQQLHPGMRPMDCRSCLTPVGLLITHQSMLFVEPLIQFFLLWKM